MQSEILFIIELLLTASLVALAVKYIKLPYTVALVIVGFVLSLSGDVFHTSFVKGTLHLTPDIIFLIFLPPLLFEGAINMDLELLKRNKIHVALLAVLGTLITSLLLGVTLTWMYSMLFLPALLIGAILSPTDPVSVLALFKEQGVDKDLSIIVEGESVFNDGLGIVLYLVLLDAVLHPEHLSLGSALGVFLQEATLAVLIGTAVGYLVHRILGKIDDHLTEVTISLVLAYGVYILADSLHTSGVIAVVCAGLILGNFGKVLSMSPTTRLTLTSFWEVAAFIANSLLFLMMGLEINISDILRHGKTILLLFILLLLFRSVSVYLLVAIANIGKYKVPLKWMHVVNWGGLRGSIPVALALGLPKEITFTFNTLSLSRQDLVTIVFGVVLLSLLIQGLSIKRLLHILHLSGISKEQYRYQSMRAGKIAINAALDNLQQLKAQGQVSTQTFLHWKQKLEDELAEVTEKMAVFLAEHNELNREEYLSIGRALLLKQRAALQEALHKGMLSEHVAMDVIKKIDSVALDTQSIVEDFSLDQASEDDEEAQ